MFERTRLGKQGVDPDRLDVVRVRVEPGSPAVEEIPVERIAQSRWRVLATPGLAQGFAADDEIEIGGDGAVISVERGGNIGVQILADKHDPAAVTELLDKAEAIGGWLDGFEPNVAVLTFPVQAGFSAIEALVQDYTQRAGAQIEWYYANVYEADGETPLSWWVTRP